MNSGVNILHVDDEAGFAGLAESYLKQEDDRFRISRAEGAEEAMELLDSDIDCVVSDYEMKRANGIELLESVRAANPSLPFILFTGKGSEEIASEAISAGVTDYLQKGSGSDQFTVLANRITNAVERYRTERRLAERNDLFGQAQEIADVGAWAHDPQSGDLSWTDKVYDLHDVDHSFEPTVDSMVDLYHPDARAGIREAIEVTESSGSHRLVAEKTAGNNRRWLQVSGEPHVEDGDVVSVRGTVRDVTEQRRHDQLQSVILDISSRLIDADEDKIDEQITEALAQIGSFEGADRSYVFKFSAGGKLMDNTHEWCASGVETQQPELQGVDTETFSWFMPGIESRETVTVPSVSDLPPEAETLRQTLESGNIKSIVTIPLTSAGSLLGFIGLDWLDQQEPWSSDTVNLLELSGNIVASALARQDTIAERRERERELKRAKTIIENTTALVYIKDSDGRYLLVNQSYEESLGMDREDILGETDFEIQSEKYAQQVRKNDQRALETGEPVEVEEAAFRNGNERTYLSVKVPIFDDGEPNAVCGISTDITEQKRREQELERTNERLNKFASVVSHDLQNPLNTLQLSLELAAETGDEEHFRRCERAVDRMNRLVEDLLTLAREGQTIDQREEIELRKVAEAAWRSISDEDATLTIDSSLSVSADPNRLDQLFTNLFKNAVEHGVPDDSEESSKLTVTVGELEHDSGFYLSDDGEGFGVSNPETVLESGYTTSQSGTGFGLSIVSEIADAHGWEVGVTDSVTGGARFEISSVDSAK